MLASSRIRAVLGSLALAALCAQGVRAETPPLPQVTPVPDNGNLPMSSVHLKGGPESVNLDAAGYVELEYYLSGNADAISADDGTALVPNAPYTTRILVRRPKNAKKFSGRAILEVFSWHGERTGGWTKVHNYAMRNGDAWIGVTLVPKRPEKVTPWLDIVWGLGQLKGYDPERYGRLELYTDYDKFSRLRRETRDDPGKQLPDRYAVQGQAILAQLATLIKSNAPTSPLAGMTVRRLYALGWQVQGEFWIDFINQGRTTQWRLADGRPLVDGFLLGNFNPYLSGGRSGNTVVPKNPPTDAVYVFVKSQREIVTHAIEGVVPGPDSDSPRVRVYDFVGSAHVGTRDFGNGDLQLNDSWSHDSIGRVTMPAGGKLLPAVCQSPSVFEPVEPVVSALLAQMDRWVETGTPMPRAPRAKVDIPAGKAIRDPQTQNIVDGLRPPWVTVPAATYWVSEETGCTSIVDVRPPYDAQKLRSLYGSYANYVKQYEAAKQDFIKAGFLLPEDARAVQPIAKPADFK